MIVANVDNVDTEHLIMKTCDSISGTCIIQDLKNGYKYMHTDTH